MASTKAQQEELAKLFAKYHSKLSYLYTSYTKRIIKTIPIGEKAEDYWIDNPLFNFDLFPELRERLNQIFIEYFNDNMLCYKQGISDGVALAYSQDDVNLGKYTILQDKAIDTARKAAQTAFYERRVQRQGGLSLSDRVWNYAQMGKSEIETAIANVIGDGITKGTSAEELGRAVRQYLNNPDMMYRRYHKLIVDNAGHKRRVVRWYRRHIDENGKVTFKDEPLEKVGTGTYRSARMNSLRLMRTEINMAYHNANNERWQREPFVIGIRIWLSPEHPEYDICDELMGEYPKNFVFSGWHPACYSDDSKVLTNNGWKLFKDVLDNDLICSLNPITREIEYVGISHRQVYRHSGDMVHFYNHALDCLVTPEHRMVYLNKTDDRIEFLPAAEYRKGNGAFYRNCEYHANDKKEIKISNTIIDFDLFCEFMGYYLSDGSLIRDWQIVISQKNGEKYKNDIIQCIEKMGFRTTTSEYFINFYSKDLNAYLKQFGICYNKFIPQEIMNASKRQIDIFLNAFIKCDGYERKSKSFINKRGNACISKNTERIFYTTSVVMAANISELLLKTGKHPSIGEKEPKDHIKKNGEIIHSRRICYAINECHSRTANTFDKEIVQYDGYVYDLTLEKNHIMYVMRNGTCYWGSNCLCASAPITIQGDEKKEFYRRLMDGEDMSNYVSPNAVKTPPAAWNKYIKDQHDNILAAGERGKLAYHLRDNTKYWLGQFSADEQKRMGFEVKKSIRQIADERHLKRTPEKEQQLRDWWQQHKYQDAIMRDANKIISEIKDFPYINIQTLSEAISKNDYNAIEKAILKIKPQLEYEKTITPNILLDSVMRKKYGDDAVNQLYQNTSRTISKYKSLSIDSLIDKMKFEADWVVNHRSFATVKEVEAYYLREAERLADKKAFDEIISKISSAKPFMSKYDIDSMLTGYEYYGDAAKLSSWFNGIEKFSDKIKRLDNIKDFIKDTKTQSSILRKLVDSIDYAIQNNGINADITKLLDEAEQKVQSLQKIHRKKTNTTTLVDLKANLGNKMPKTLENLQSLIDKEMKAMSYNNSEIAEFKKRMIDLFNNSDFGMNVPRIDRKGNDVLESIFNSWFKAQQETGTGKGCVDISLRNRASKELFGTDINNTTKNEYEKYGFLMDKDILKQAKSDIASQYWSFGDGIQIRFKKDKVITTFTMEDSLNSGLNPSLTTDPFPTSSSSINRIVTGKPLTSAIEATWNWARSYIELQYHGDLTLDCIESIFIPEDVVGKLSKTLIDKMRKYAIIYSESNDNLITL